ncbi:penicillin-binding transpeptidase domain-containing protein [Deinococcus radiophilus]|uniref:penicillin-binding transpeptidase domain-containing protein n=1 Tax=Deinococcus radiophilus TaxID=32062 RepID=UPI00361D4D66
MAAAFNVLANDGLYIPPKLVEGSTFGERREVLKNTEARQIKPMLQTALEGIRHAAGINGYSCAGKTGTAQLVEDGKYVKGQYNSTYAGFCQTHDPRITIAVMVHGAKVESGMFQGSQLAAPIFQELSASIISMWGLPPENIPEGYSVGVPSTVWETEENNAEANVADVAAEGEAAEETETSEEASPAPTTDAPTEEGAETQE